ncbi:hypothetical protein TVAG_102100 [Trichomonas vaginalis G3]|uniref:Uncharacterized protein n=1 Tax=Trichomonas vaginalis (strain ATCC PRA-98 / G3) TaxID=412133 RepID=A2FEF9_TRIV3|nr:uncharacterized protein TVAGG3_1091760 [Trichomonas vaginalis G3]XP_001293938.1 hypothetical protein TVAGG3_0650830 [Trichomonas vaginalis G3]XP_001299181.1 uncharacterized protein TVAGG3_1091970 [Trichomonas vaginalis G3]XP_001309635.1 hypothetical protein TVAGG3_0700990 [Trichomonas vaginalis G3]XP_051094371.1 hypothetical protein TVAGG3_0500040 [Trichomonas vaginalis G3]XP_051094401.1 hypothetical protein TVAGG3_0500490 [Trichomonas vaginalis G3]XP_051104322.1 hypothetical protein TVAGG|eukprot:XP_001277517.1 hypothetical protein [Trichomonas vaginalis G3]
MTKTIEITNYNGHEFKNLFFVPRENTFYQIRGRKGKVSLSVYDNKHNGRYIKAIDTNGKRVSLALSKLTNIYFDSDFDLYEEESESEDYELLCEAQQWEELQYFCK